MKFRPHRGGLAESMEETIEIQTLDQLVAHLNARTPYILTLREALIIEPYGGIDARTGWDTHIVTDKFGVVGFTDGPMTALLGAPNTTPSSSAAGPEILPADTQS